MDTESSAGNFRCSVYTYLTDAEGYETEPVSKVPHFVGTYGECVQYLRTHRVLRGYRLAVVYPSGRLASYV